MKTATKNGKDLVAKGRAALAGAVAAPSRVVGGTTYRPLADRVLVELDEPMSKTPGGVLMPETAAEKPNKGVVRAVGPGKKDQPVDVKVGQKVLVGRYAGTEVPGEDRLRLFREDDILAVVETA